jgi:hypothetical protein
MEPQAKMESLARPVLLVPVVYLDYKDLPEHLDVMVHKDLRVHLDVMVHKDLQVHLGLVVEVQLQLFLSPLVIPIAHLVAQSSLQPIVRNLLHAMDRKATFHLAQVLERSTSAMMQLTLA